MIRSITEALNSQKVELKAEKVELGLVQDIEKKTNQILGQVRKLDKSFPALEKLTIQVNQEKASLQLYAKEAERVLTAAASSAKELGIPVDEIKGYKVLNIEVQNAKTSYK